MNWTNCVAIVTGASSGIGLATARMFVERGAKVALVARTASKLEAHALALGPNAVAFPLDVTKHDELAALPARVKQHFGRLDIVVNNAGNNTRGEVKDRTAAELTDIIDTNLLAPILLSRASIPLMEKGGVIVHVASLAGKVPIPHEATYSASKAGIRAFSRALHLESHGEVRSVCVNPGPVATGFLGADINDVPDLVFSQPMSSSDDVAVAVVHACERDVLEIDVPAMSGKLATVAYLSPTMYMALRPVMEKKGAKAKQRYLAQGGSEENLTSLAQGGMKKLIAALVLFASFEARAELSSPEPSPAAAVEQTVGITQLRVSYRRPAVAGRKIWGGLVPYNEVWRAGANENTTLMVSSPVKIAGKVLPAGTYGLHIIPTEKAWTVILSTASTSWGSYTYDQKEDAVRASVTPVSSEVIEERLSFTFDDPNETSTNLVMRWEKVKLALKIEVDTNAVVMAKMKSELRGGAQFDSAAWDQAARYWITHGGNVDEAAKMADRSIASKETYRNLTTRAMIADKKGDAKTATAMRAKADAVATEADFNTVGYELLGQKKFDEAITVFTKNTTAFPGSWNAHDSLGEALMIKGDKAAASAAYKKALSLVKDEANKKRIEQTIAKLDKQG